MDFSSDLLVMFCTIEQRPGQLQLQFKEGIKDAALSRMNKRTILNLLKDNSGRVRPFFLAFFILSFGLILQSEWWKVGFVMLIALFIGAYYRYTAPR